MITTCPSWRLRRGRTHFCCNWRLWRNSPFLRTQNLFARCCMRFHLFRRYKSARWNGPGGGRTTLDFPVSRWLGVIGANASGDVKFSTVKGWLLTTASTSVIKVWRDSLLSWPPHWSSKTESTLRAVLICHSQMPPMWLADGTLSWNSIQSQLRSLRKWWTQD